MKTFILLQVVGLPGVGRVRITRSSELSEYRVRATSPEGSMVAEYFTDDKSDAFCTADSILDELIKAASAPA